MEKLIPKIIAWAEDRNIVRGSDLEKETLKLVYKCGKLANFMDNKEACNDAIGQCMLQMIIICRMQHITLDECLKFTKSIKDVRVADPTISSILFFKTIGELAEKISTKKDIKTEIGYLLIYMTALTKSLDLSIKECTENAFQQIKDIKGVMFDGELIDETHEKYSIALSIVKSNVELKN